MRYLLISNLYNEQENTVSLFDTVEAQTLPPSLWLVVNDGSTDDTGRLIEERVTQTRLRISVWTAPAKTAADYDTIGVSIRSALGSLAEEYGSFDYFCVLDADSRVGPEYFEKLLGRMEADSRIGMASGTVWVEGGPERTRRDLARGSGRATRADVWRSVAIADLPDVVSDAFFNAKAKMMGYSPVMFDDLRILERRPTTQMTPAGQYRKGRLMAMFWYSPLVLFAHSAALLLRGRNSLPLIKGYLEGLKANRIQDEDVRLYFSRRMLIDAVRERILRPRSG